MEATYLVSANGIQIGCSYSLSVGDVLAVRTVSDQYRDLGICLWSVDVASHNASTALEWDRDILTENVWEGLVVSTFEVSDFVRHIGDMFSFADNASLD